jgi:hypothetical protein
MVRFFDQPHTLLVEIQTIVEASGPQVDFTLEASSAALILAMAQAFESLGYTV